MPNIRGVTSCDRLRRSRRSTSQSFHNIAPQPEGQNHSTGRPSERPAQTCACLGCAAPLLCAPGFAGWPNRCNTTARRRSTRRRRPARRRPAPARSEPHPVGPAAFAQADQPTARPRPAATRLYRARRPAPAPGGLVGGEITPAGDLPGLRADK